MEEFKNFKITEPTSSLKTGRSASIIHSSEEHNKSESIFHDSHGGIGFTVVNNQSESRSDSNGDNYSGQHAVKRKRSLRSRIFMKVYIFIISILIIALALRIFVLEAYEIPSGSMETTIMTGDMVFAEKFTYLNTTPKRGEIVTFMDPNPAISNRTLIKRVVAVSGDTVDLKNGYVYINGVMQDEPYTHGQPSRPLTSYQSEPIGYPYTVPEGKIWVMGDNRGNSSDSRYFGAVDVSSVTGHAFMIYWPLDRIQLI